MTTLDAMILVAATASGFGVLGLRFTQISWGDYATVALASPLGGWSVEMIMSRLTGLTGLMIPFLMAWAPTLLILRAIPPRPRAWSLAQQPGTIACAAATLPAAVHYATFLIMVAMNGNFGVDYPVELLDHFSGPLPAFLLGGLGLAIAWAMLALTGRWRPEPSWIDRMGRGLGTCWIAIALIEPIFVELIRLVW